MFFIHNIPNLFTSLNLLCGCIGIVHVTSGRLVDAVYFVWAGAFFDFLDGFSAKLLKVQSKLGKEHDSLADMVTFGVLPAFVVFKLMENHGWVAYLSFVITVFSALRLAKFNIDACQDDVFIGLPTPASALFFTGLVLEDSALISRILTPFPTLLIVAGVFSLLLVAPLKFIALKTSPVNGTGNGIKLILVTGAFLILALMGIEGISVTILWYIGVSLIGNMMSKL